MVNNYINEYLVTLNDYIIFQLVSNSTVYLFE